MHAALPIVTLRAGHVQPVWAGHPWIYRQAIQSIDGSPAAGDEVLVRDARSNLLGRGFFSPESAIPVKLATRDAEESLDQEWLAGRLTRAIERRLRFGLPSTETDSYRLVNSEGDGIPGLIVDRYGSAAVLQLLTAGLARREALVVAALREALPELATLIAVDGGAAVRAEGLDPTGPRVLAGTEPEALVATERGLGWTIPLRSAQKTGFYFDQRANRAAVEAVAAGRRVLDLFSYCGGFALAASRGGATEVIAIDRSEGALEIGRAAADTAGLRVDFRQTDVRRAAAELASQGESFDLVILDPPKLARGARDVEGALGRYAELNRLALGLLAPNGRLVSCSCSGAVGSERFLRAVARAGAEVGRPTTLLEVAGAGPDHPSPPAFPEGRYLTVATVELL